MLKLGYCISDVEERIQVHSSLSSFGYIARLTVSSGEVVRLGFKPNVGRLY